MIKKLLIGLAFTLSLSCAQARAEQPVYGANGANTGIPSNAPLLTSAPSAQMTDERTLRSQFGNITLTDGGANSYLDINWSGQLGLTNGGTGGATAQAGTNNLLDGSAGAVAANGDQMVRVGSTWTRVPIGADTYVWTVSGTSIGWQPATSGGAPTGASYVAIALNGTLTSERVLTGTTNRVTINDGGANGNVTLDVGSDVVLLTAPQTLTSKTLTSPSIGTSLIFELGANDTTITATAPATTGRTINIPDPGTTGSNFVLTESAQTINGVKTMGSATRFNANIQNSSGNTITLPSSTATLATQALAETLTNKTATSLILDGTPVFKSTNQYNITINNPAGNRDYSITDVGGSANFIMGTGSYTNQGIAISNGSLLTWLGPGTNDQVLKMSGSTVGWGTDNSSGFGGGGNAGATTKGAVTETTPLSIDATTFTQTVSTTWAPLSGTIVNCTSTADFNGTTNIGAGYAGGAAMFSGNGSSPGKIRTNLANGGGGGGGNAGSGGDGGNASGSGGPAMPFSFDAGSGGAGSISATGTSAGGAGGGKLKVCAVGAITIGVSGSINAAGSAGANNTTASCSAGGGGAGGTVILASQTSITQTGTATVAGGNGGNGGASGSNAYGGGGGAGGWYVRVSPSNSGAGSITVTGGTGGTGNSGAGTSGGNGTAMAITATPNQPLMGSLDKHLPVLAAFARINAPDPHDLKLSEKQLIGTLAALESNSTQEYENLCHLYRFGEDFTGSKVVRLDSKRGEKMEALRNAS